MLAGGVRLSRGPIGLGGRLVVRARTGRLASYAAPLGRTAASAGITSRP
jgi:hypothetical protein